MNLSKRFSAVFAVLGVLLLAGAVLMSFFSLDASAVLIGGGKKAQAQTQAFMEAVCARDGSAAGSLLLGNPELGIDSVPQTELGAIFWEAYGGSLSYEFSGDCYAGESDLCRDVTITVLDIPAVMGSLQQQLPALLSAQVAVSDPNEVYNEDGTYRDAFVMDLLCREAEAILQSEECYVRQTITLHLTSQNGKWLIHPEAALMNLLAGNMDM